MSRGSMPRRTLSAAIAACALALSIGLGLASAKGNYVPYPMRATPALEVRPVAGGEWFAWAEAPKARPKDFRVVARRGRGYPFRVNPPGTRAFPGSIWRSVLVYEQRRRGDWNIALYDLAARKHLRPPAGVNTKQDEVRASLSGNWLLFARLNARGRPRGLLRVLLRNLKTGKQIQLERVAIPEPKAFDPTTARAFSAQVNGRYAVVSACRGCPIRVYDIRRRRQMPFRIPPTGEQESSNYAFSISANGTVYFARSDESNPCGTVDLVSRAVRARYWLELDRLPPDLGISSTYTASRPGWTSVYFTRGLGCGDNPDAYALDLREFSGRQAAG